MIIMPVMGIIGFMFMIASIFLVPVDALTTKVKFLIFGIGVFWVLVWAAFETSFIERHYAYEDEVKRLKSIPIRIPIQRLDDSIKKERATRNNLQWAEEAHF